MKKILFAIIIYLPIKAMAAEPESLSLSKVKSRIDAMYSDLKNISNTNASTASEKRISFSKNYFLTPDQFAPNEFKSLGYGEQSYSKDIRVDSYINNFYDMFRDQNYADCSFSYERMHSSLVHGPEYVKGEALATTAVVIVRKIYSRGGKPFRAFEDTLVVGLKEMKVNHWANRTSRLHVGDIGDGAILNIEQMMESANLLYEKKRYKEAYQIYEMIVKKYPEEGNPYYRMAIMLYKKKYGNFLKKKERHRLILDYLDKAIWRGGDATKKCADNMRYWITC